MIPLSVPNICGNEWNYVKECLDSEWVSSAGKFVNKFEDLVAEYVGCKFAIACTNGTSALQLSLRLLGVKSGTEVIVPSLTFIAPVNAIKYNNAFPIFMDVDEFYNIDTTKTIEFIKKETYFKKGHTYNKKTNKRIAAIIPIHMWGNAANIEDLLLISKERNIPILEDSSESLGTFYKKEKHSGKHTGTIGNIGCLSFNGNKIITTGGGGMILTDSQKLAEQANYLSKQAKDDPVRYIHNDIGYNFRLTNIQAAIGVAQMELLPKFLEIKSKIFKIYKKEINQINGLKIADAPFYSKNNHWMILLQINQTKYGKNRESLMKFLSKKGIQTRPAWSPIHLQKPYKKCQSFLVEKTIKLVENSLCLPSSTNISDDNIYEVINHLRH